MWKELGNEEKEKETGRREDHAELVKARTEVQASDLLHLRLLSFPMTTISQGLRGCWHSLTQIDTNINTEFFFLFYF